MLIDTFFGVFSRQFEMVLSNLLYGCLLCTTPLIISHTAFLHNPPSTYHYQILTCQSFNLCMNVVTHHAYLWWKTKERHSSQVFYRNFWRFGHRDHCNKAPIALTVCFLIFEPVFYTRFE